jgi:endoglucanase
MYKIFKRLMPISLFLFFITTLLYGSTTSQAATTYVKIKNHATGIYMDGMGLQTNGDNCSQYSNSSSYNQQWSISTYGQFYRIQNRATGLYLDGMGQTSNGSDLGQWSSSNSYNQMWQKESSGNYTKFKNVATGLYIDGLGSSSNGSVLGQWSSNNSSNQEWLIEEISDSSMRDITTMALVREMGVGINLGNTMESTGSWIDSSSVTNYETGWGSPVITQAMIQGYANEGFGVLRIPVAWSNMMGDNYTINSSYMARVKEIADWALDSGMYVIINLHWDGGWFENFPTQKDTWMYKYERIWTQVSATFKDYGDYLMFESFNEEGNWPSLWNIYSQTSSSGKEQAYALINEINQKFVDTVRASGGNNPKRHLLIAGYNTDIPLTCDALYKVPSDSQNRLAVSVHYYTPSTFTLLEKDESWGKMRTTWGTSEDYAELNNYMDMVKKNFIDKGIPVIMGEFGLPVRSNKTQDAIRLYLSAVCNAAYSRQIAPVLWDTTGDFYNRTTCQMNDKVLLQQLMSVKQ